VRKISAQAILPLIKFEEYVTVELVSQFKEFLASIELGGKKLRQNEAHGLMVRINVFLSAYFQYRDSLSKQLGPGHHQEKEEATLISLFEGFEQMYGKVS
jgi:hypothetical protein